MTEINPYDSPQFSERDPQVVDTAIRRNEPSGIGGWLILVAIGVVLSPLRLGAFMLTYIPMFTDGTWDALTSPSSAGYHPLWAPLLTFEMLGNTAFAVAYLVLAVLFFRKSRLFPKTYIALALANLCFVVGDTWFASLVLQNQTMFDENTAGEIARSVVSTAIWVPYMLVSKRVKNTFVT